MKSIIRGGPFKRGSQWLSDLLCMCELFENESGWFQNGIGRVVGDGSNTSFWEAKWLEGRLRWRSEVLLTARRLAFD